MDLPTLDLTPRTIEAPKEKRLNSVPQLAPVPRDVAVWAGDGLTYGFGQVFDADGDTVTFEIDLGRASNFTTFNETDRTLRIAVGTTSNTTAGRYTIDVKLTDNAGLDRGGPKSNYFSFSLYVRFRPQIMKSSAGDPNINVLVKADEIYPILIEPLVEKD